MELELRTLLHFGIPEALEILNQGFSDYLIPIQLDLPRFHHMLRSEGIDVNISQVVLKEGKAVGVALIARRGWSSRLAGMAIIPEARGQRVGLWVMQQLITEAKERGDRRMELEVIEQNEPAVYLYQKVGFQTLRRLISFRLVAPEGESVDPIEIDVRELADRVNYCGLPNLPWQLSGESLAATGPPHRAFRLDSAFVALTNPEEEHIILRSLLVFPAARRQGQARQLLQALFARFSDKTWVVPAIFPEEMGVFFENLGFEKQALSQFQMELAL